MTLWRVEKDLNFGGNLVDWWARARHCPTWPDTTSYDADWHSTWADVSMAGGVGTIFGYVYAVFTDETMTNRLGWYPSHPDSTLWVWNYSTITTSSFPRESPDGTAAPAMSVTTTDGVVSFRFNLAAGTTVGLDIFDVRGRLVAALTPGMLSSGVQEIRWDDASNLGAPAGVYFARLRAGDRQDRVKFILR